MKRAGILIPAIVLASGVFAAPAFAQDDIPPPASAVRAWEAAGGSGSIIHQPPCPPKIPKTELTAEQIACAIEHNACHTINFSSCEEMVRLGMQDCISYVRGDETSAQQTLVECILKYAKETNWTHMLCDTLGTGALRYKRYAKEECLGFTRYLDDVPVWVAAYAGFALFVAFVIGTLVRKRRALPAWFITEIGVSGIFLFLCGLITNFVFTACMGGTGPCSNGNPHDQELLAIITGSIAVAAVFITGVWLSTRLLRAPLGKKK